LYCICCLELDPPIDPPPEPQPQEEEIARAAWMHPDQVLKSRLYQSGGMLGAHMRAALDVSRRALLHSEQVGMQQVRLPMSPLPKAPLQNLYYGGKLQDEWLLLPNKQGQKAKL